jgi:hypothetical protein
MITIKTRIVKLDIDSRPFCPADVSLTETNEAILAVIKYCNSENELGHHHRLHMVLEATGKFDGPIDKVKYVEINVNFVRHIDPDEIICEQVLGDFMEPWIQTFGFEQEEEVIPKGMSFVHLFVRDQTMHGQVDGRVTACVTKSDGIYKISFAFCRNKDNFTRRRGRKVSMMKMADGDFITVIDCGASRHDMVANVITDYIYKGKSVSDENISFPEWLLPRARVDLDDRVASIIRKIATGEKITPDDISDAKYMLGMDNLERVCVIDRE